MIMSTRRHWETRLFINGRFVKGKQEKTFELVNPANEEKVCDVHVALEEDVDAAVAAAKAAQPAWEAVPAAQKANLLRKLGQLCVENTLELAEADSIAMGRPLHGPLGAIAGVGDIPLFMNYWAGLCENIHGHTSLSTPSIFGMVLRQPFGVCGAIIPWNAPALVFLTKVAPCIGAGNTMVLKSSEKAPLSSIVIARLCKEAGIPDGVVNVVSGLGYTGSLLASNMVIRKISFTGSTATGRAVQKAATESNLKDCALELGGKSAAIVWKDADIDSAVHSAMWSFTWNSGQLCASNSRLYVHKDVIKDFTTKLIASMTKLSQGDPTKEHVELGPQADAIQGKKVLDYIELGKKEAKVLVGGKRAGAKGWFVEPTLFADVAQDSRLNKEEIFGPVAVLHEIGDDEEEALRLANDTEYGLFATIYTKDLERAMRFARRLESGTVGVNVASPTILPDLPAGGYKTSGIGREYGHLAVEDWTETKTVFIASKL